MMESDVEGQPSDKLSLNEGVLKDDMEVKNDMDINVSSSTKGDIETKLGTVAKSDEVYTSGETENSLGDLTENKRCRGNSLETADNAKVENEKSVDEKLENRNPAEKCISDAVKNTVAEDAGKIIDKLEEPDSANTLFDKSRIDLLDKENVTDVDKSSEINYSVDIEPKSPEIGFRRKSFSQFSPLSSPVKSPSQMSETSPVRSPELGGRRRLKVHVFDRELATADGGASKQEQSSERTEDEKVKEGITHSPDFMSKEQVAENQESSPSQIDNTASTSPCIEEEGSKDLNLLDSNKCILDVMEGEFLIKHTQEKPMPCSDKVPETSELSKEASPLNKPLLSVERKLSLSFYRRETTSLYTKGIDENESDVNDSTSSEDFCKEKDSDPEKPEDGLVPGKSEISIGHEEPEDSITPENPQDIIASENPEDSIPSEKPEDSIAPENPQESISFDNHEDSLPSDNHEDSLHSENSEDSITSEKLEDTKAPEEPEDSIPSENPEDSMPYENPDGSTPSETHEDSIPSENTDDSLPSEKQENSIATENSNENISSENPEDSIHSDKSEDSIHSDKYEDIKAPEKPGENIAPEKPKDEDSVASEKPEESVASKKLEDSTIASKKPEDSVASEKPKDSVASKKPEDSVASEEPEDSVASEKPEDSIASKKPEDSVASKKHEDSVASKKPEDSVASKKPEKPEDSIASKKPEDGVTSKKPEDSVASEKPEDSVVSKKSEDSVASKMEVGDTYVKPLTADTEKKARTDERSLEDDQKVGNIENYQGSGSSSDGSYEGMSVSGEDTEKDHSLPESNILNPSESVQSIVSSTVGNEKLQLTGDSLGNVENDQGSGSSSDGSYEGMRVSGEDAEKYNSLPESDILNPSERVQSIAPFTLDNEKLQLTGDSLGDEGSGDTHVTKRKKRSRDSDPGKLRDGPGPKRYKVYLDTKENTDHNDKDDVEVSSSGTSPVDMKVEFVDISSEEERQSESRYVDAIDMVCKKCRDIWNDEVLRMIFKGTESVTVNSKITYGAIVCINDWINRNLSVDKEEAITQVFERTDLGSNIAQLNIRKLDQWLGELLHRGKNKCCKVFTAVYQPKKNTALHKTKRGTKRPKAHVPQSIPIHTKNQKSAVSIGQKSSGTKGPSVPKSQSLSGNKSQSPTVNKGQSSVIATCPDLPKGRVYLVPAPAVASVLPSALAAKSLPKEESAVLPSSASSLMKPCKIILKNPVPVRSKDNIQNPNGPSTKSHPSGSSAGMKSGESKTAVSSKCVSRPSIGKPGLSSSRDKSLRATGHGNTFNSKELSKTGVNKVPILQQARPSAVPLSKMMSQGQTQSAHVMDYEEDEQEDVKDFVTEVESMIFSQEPIIREMLQALNLDIKDVNIYSSYCNIPITNKMKVDCPSERDKISPCYFSMLKERSALNGHALIAFDLLLYESSNQHSVTSRGSIKSRFVTKRELLTLQSIFILNPETPDISLFYEVFVQILLSRKKVLLIPDSHTFLVVTEDIRKEYNRAKSKDLSIQILNENWDPNNIYSADDAWLEGQNLNPEEVTNRDVISIFCTWRNLGKEPNDQSLSKALQSLRQFHNVRNGDYFGSCFRLYTKFIRFVYEEKELELAKVLLDEPFIGGCCIVSKKFLQNLINFKKQKNNLPNYDDDVDDFKDAVERFEELETLAYENLNTSILRDLCSQMITIEEKLKVFIENNEVISKRLTNLLGKRERLLREIKGPEIRRLLQTMRASIVELHKVAQKRRQESYNNKTNKRKKCDLDMKDSDLDSSCTDVSPHIKELIKDLLSKGVKPDKVRQVIGIVSGITKEEKLLEIPSEKWISNFAQMYS